MLEKLKADSLVKLHDKEYITAIHTHQLPVEEGGEKRKHACLGYITTFIQETVSKYVR